MQDIKRTKAYLLKTTLGDIQIDEDEVLKVLKAKQAGHDVLLRRGLVSPAFIGLIVEDKDREYDYKRDVRNGDRKAETLGMEPLESIFTTDLMYKLTGGSTDQLPSHTG